MRFEGTCYRAHDPRWSFKPLSGESAALRGARFTPKRMPALYLAPGVMTAIKEANQGFAHKIEPCVLCSYEVACDNIADLRTPEGRAEHNVRFEDMACPWFSLLAQGKEPPSWKIVRRLYAEGKAGILVTSFAPGATAEDYNLVLWRWSDQPPYRVQVFDPSGRLPKDQLSWSRAGPSRRTRAPTTKGDRSWAPYRKVDHRGFVIELAFDLPLLSSPSPPRAGVRLNVGASGAVMCLDELMADGILVATPVGSTAYNLSMHGPIIPLGSESRWCQCPQHPGISGISP